MKGRLWHLELSSFAGMVAWASHYMATLRGPDGQDYEVEWRIDEETAERWTKADMGFRYRPGSRQRRFDSEKAAREASVVAWRTVADEDRDMLVKGTIAMMDPQHPLAGPMEIRKKAAELYKRALHVDFWSDEGAMRPIANEWDELISSNFVKDSFRYPGPDVRVIVMNAVDGDEKWVLEKVL